MISSAIPSYWNSYQQISCVMLSQMQSFMNRFLWQGSMHKNGYTPISWNQVIQLFCDGGLSIRGLKLQNKVALAHTIWRFLTEKPLMGTHLVPILSLLGFLWKVWIQAYGLPQLEGSYQTQTSCANQPTMGGWQCHDVRILKDKWVQASIHYEIAWKFQKLNLRIRTSNH